MFFCAGQEEEGKGRTKPRIIRRWLDGKPGLCGDVTTSNDATLGLLVRISRADDSHRSQRRIEGQPKGVLERGEIQIHAV